MKFVESPLQGLVVIEPQVHGDARGFFLETFRADLFEKHSLPTQFVQDNFSRSAQGILRGMHFQKAPHAQGKLVRVTLGSVWDVAVDLRPNSKTFGKHFGIELSESNKKMMFIPEGFAHGFCVLSETADFFYKCTKIYSPQYEEGLLWNDPTLNIDWPIKEPLLSGKDKAHPSFLDWKKKNNL